MYRVSEGMNRQDKKELFEDQDQEFSKMMEDNLQISKISTNTESK